MSRQLFIGSCEGNQIIDQAVCHKIVLFSGCCGRRFVVVRSFNVLEEANALLSLLARDNGVSWNSKSFLDYLS